MGCSEERSDALALDSPDATSKVFSALFACVALLIAACNAAPTPTTMTPVTLPAIVTPSPTSSATATLAATPTTPPRPQRMSDVPQAILVYLNADARNLATLKTTLASWGLNTTPTPYAADSDIVMSGDVDGDGQSDVVVALGQSPPFNYETGALAPYLRQGAGGETTADVLAFACFRCNRYKGSGLSSI